MLDEQLFLLFLSYPVLVLRIRGAITAEELPENRSLIKGLLVADVLALTHVTHSNHPATEGTGCQGQAHKIYDVFSEAELASWTMKVFASFPDPCGDLDYCDKCGSEHSEHDRVHDLASMPPSFLASRCARHTARMFAHALP